MTFRVGQKVVCVSIGSFDPPYPWPRHIVVNGVYTIRDVDVRLPGILFLRLEEYLAPVVNCSGLIVGPFEVAFNSSHFRPALEKKTDISIFTALLNPARRELVSSVIGEDINTL